MKSDIDIELALKLAKKKFLGRVHVVGVGIAYGETEGLVFFLDSISPESETEITQWASRTGVPAEVRVVTKFQPLRTTP